MEYAVKIWFLIKKDLIFCFGWILTAAILVLLMPAYFLYMSDLNEVFLEPVCLFSTILGANIAMSRICYIEDNYETRKLLSAMPVTGSQLVLSRYIEGLVFTVSFMLLAICSGNLFLGISLHLEFVLAFLFGGLVFEGVYLLFYYKWGSTTAQYAFLGTAGLIGAACLILDRMGIALDHTTLNPEKGALLLLVGLGIYGISAFVSCRFCRFYSV